MAIEAVDYVVFALMFAFSAAIGLYSAYRNRQQATSMENFHRAGRKAGVLPVSLSLAVTIINGVNLLSIPADVYMNGTMIIWMGAGMLVATFGTAHIFVPVFYKTNRISSFAYLELRFGRTARLVTSIAYLVCYFFIVAVILYAPCLAFQAMTNVSLYSVMGVTAAVCILYTLLGGMKAVLWADSLQFGIIVAGFLTTLIATSIQVGNFSTAWEIANRFKRLEFFNFSPDPRTRHTVWSLTIGFGLLWSYAYGGNQSTLQRATSLSSLRKAQLAVWLNFPCQLLVLVLLVLVGVAMFAFYHSCDPLTEEKIQKADQLLPFLILDLVKDLPGLAGLMLATIFSGSLSTLSSALSALSAVAVEDAYPLFVKTKQSERTLIIVSRIAVVIAGGIAFAIAVIISNFGGLVQQLVFSIGSVLGAPTLGMFVSGMLFPWINCFGACAGFICSFGINIWLVLGALFEAKPTPPLPLSVSGCVSEGEKVGNNITEILNTSINTVANTGLDGFYGMSYNWYTGFGLMIFLIVALLVSFLTGSTDPKTINSDLMCPFFYNVCFFLPEKYRKFLLLGVDYRLVAEKTRNNNQVEIKTNGTIEQSDLKSKKVTNGNTEHVQGSWSTYL